MNIIPAVLLVIVAAMLGYRLEAAFGFAPDLGLAALIAAGGMLPLSEFLLVLLAAGWILFAGSAPGIEIWMFGSIPILLAFRDRLLPLSAVPAAAVASGIGVAVFSLAYGPEIVLRHGAAVATDVLISAAGGAAAAWLLRSIAPSGLRNTDMRQAT